MRGPAAAALMLMLLLPAGAPAGTDPEVDYLLRFIGESGCVFVRNGKEYGSAEAREHILRKYRYVENRVKSAEDFIQHTATRSSTTGTAYLVRCEGRELPAARWLQDELGSHRSRQEHIPPGKERGTP